MARSVIGFSATNVTRFCHEFHELYELVLRFAEFAVWSLYFYFTTRFDSREAAPKRNLGLPPPFSATNFTNYTNDLFVKFV